MKKANHERDGLIEDCLPKGNEGIFIELQVNLELINNVLVCYN